MPAPPSRIAEDVFRSIVDANPALIMHRVEHSHYYDAELNIPAQPGLSFPVHMNLQNGGELHLVVDPFWGKWFPCSDPKKARAFIAAVNGLLSGEYRIRVTSRDGRAVKAVLQAPRNGGWKMVFTSGRLHLPIGRKRVSCIQNR